MICSALPFLPVSVFAAPPLYPLFSAVCLAAVTLLVLIAACALSDLLTRRIPNSLIGCGLLCAAASRAGAFLYRDPQPHRALLPAGPPGRTAALLMLADMAAGFLLPYLLMGVLVRLKMLGGGDVKLLSVIGMQVGWRGTLRMMWYSLLAAAGVSAVLILRKRNLPERLEYLRRYVGRAVVTGRAGHYRGMGSQSGEFAFAVPVLLAWILYLVQQEL